MVTRYDWDEEGMFDSSDGYYVKYNDYAALEDRVAALREADEWRDAVLVPVEVVDLCWNVIDNLSDTPINDDWAKRTADRLIQLLDAEVKDEE